jgi:hypothetical protein
MSVEITLDTKGFNKACFIFPKSLFSNMRESFRNVGNEFLKTLTVERLKGRPGLMRRTGSLARSFGKVVIGNSTDDLLLSVYTDSKYARIHEHGGTIKPKPGRKYLAIPLNPAKTGSGVSRFGSPRNIAGLKFGGFSKAGNIILRNVQGVPMFVLVSQVKIPARLGMFSTWERDSGKNVKIINEGIAKTLKEW